MGIPLGEYRASVTSLLDQFEADALQLIELIAQQGKSFAFMEAKICEQIALAIREIDDEWATALLACLGSIVEDPRASVQQWIKSPEIRREALERLAATG